MKKFIYMTALALACSTVYAQDEEVVDVLEAGDTQSSENLSKNGHQITPLSGDIGLGFNGNIALDYVGNAFNGTNGNNASSDFVQSVDQAIFLKYLKDDATAYRVKFGINQSAISRSNFVQQDQQADQDVVVEDKVHQENSSWTIGVGLEKRRGNHRIQGIYGAELVINRLVQNNIYNYGNAMTATNIDPTSTQWAGTSASAVNNNPVRTIADYGDRTFSFTVQAFIGVEYFVAPRLSIGGEFSFGPTMSWIKEGEQHTEEFNGVEVENHITYPNEDTGLIRGITTGNYNGSVNMMFYF